MKSRTCRYTEDGEIELTEVEVGDPGPGQVQVEVSVCGICSWDVATCKLGSDFEHPAPPGHEGVGYIRKIGPGVEGFEAGDRVAAGGFCAVCNRPAGNVYKVPESDLADEYWIVEPVSCAVTGLDHCRLSTGDRVAVIGCGFMGLLILQGLMHSLAGQVVGIDIQEEKLRAARNIGVEEVYNTSRTDPDDLAEELHARGIDVVVDTSGSEKGLDLAARIVKRGGLINLFGWVKGKRATFDPSLWHAGGFTVVNSSPSSRLRNPFPAAIRMMQKGVFDLQPLVTHVVPLEQYPALMRRIIEGDPTYIKGVVRLS